MGENAVETFCERFPVDWLVMPRPHIATFDVKPGVVFQVVPNNNDIRRLVFRREPNIALVEGPSGHLGGQ